MPAIGRVSGKMHEGYARETEGKRAFSKSFPLIAPPLCSTFAVVSKPLANASWKRC